MESIDSSTVERSSSEPIVFDDLPPQEQEIAQIASKEGEYRRCYFNLDPSKQDAVSSLGNRGCYLRRGQKYYVLTGAILDDSIC